MTPDEASPVAWPDRRSDIIEAVSALVTLRPGEPPSWPDLTTAIHWLIDDTFGDQRSPSQDIGLLLRDVPDANAMTALIEPLMSVLHELGPHLPDDAYLNQTQWDRPRPGTGGAAVLAGSH